MEKGVIMRQFFFGFLAFLSCSPLYALPIGNPVDPVLLCDGLFYEGSCCRLLDFCDPGASWCEAFSFRAGYYGDFVFQRSMEIDRHEASDFIENTEIFTNAGYLILNIWDRLDLFATLGATNIFLDTNASSFRLSSTALLSGNRFELETETAFSWSIGARVILWQCGCTYLGAEAQYFASHPDIERVSLHTPLGSAGPSPTNSAYPDDNISLKYREWQFGLALAHRINNLIPYVGIKWAHAQMDMDDARFTFIGITDPSATATINLHDLESRKDVGYAIGVTLTDCSKKSLTIEARFADEKALHINGQIRF